MTSGHRDGPRSALAWFLFPMVPALVGHTYHNIMNLSIGRRGGPDPREWGWAAWLILAGPLAGYGFLAGATAGLPDAQPRPGVRGWLAGRRSIVAVGPWIGFLAWSGLFFLAWLASAAVVAIHPSSREWRFPAWPDWDGTWPGWLVNRGLVIAAVGSAAYGWLVVAWAVLGRARGLGELGRTLRSGLAVAAGFVGSLFGTFWAITEAWRSYFFDPRVIPALVAAAGLVLASGCAATETYGEIRRRELFQSLLMAWLVGLALAWRWWSRPRRKTR